MEGGATGYRLLFKLDRSSLATGWYRIQCSFWDLVIFRCTFAFCKNLETQFALCANGVRDVFGWIEGKRMPEYLEMVVSLQQFDGAIRIELDDVGAQSVHKWKATSCEQREHIVELFGYSPRVIYAKIRRVTPEGG